MNHHSSSYAGHGQAGYRLADLPIGEHRLTCPECGRGPKDRTMGVTVTHEGAVAHCFRCNHVEHYRDRRSTCRPGKAVICPVESQKRETLSSDGRRFWDTCKVISGPARAYLERRHCVIPPEDGDLRWHPALRHPDGYIGPALVGLITNVLTREPMSLHRTWLLADGSDKANVNEPKRVLPGHRKQGGCIRLWPDEAITTSLSVAEGIESVLSLAHAHPPAWSLVDANNLAGFHVLPGIEDLVIGVDRDPAGLDAVRRCGARWHAAGVRVQVADPKKDGADLNDIAKEAAR